LKYNTIGSSGLEASVIGLGTEFLYDASEKTIDETVNTAIDRGVNVLDMVVPSASMREKVGRAIKGKRDKLIIHGHIGSTDLNKQFDVSRHLPTVKKYFEGLLKALNTDYIDIGILFLIDNDEEFAKVFESDILEYALDLKSKGVLRTLGASSHNTATAARMVNTGLIDLLMFPVNPAHDIMDADRDGVDVSKDFYQGVNIANSARADLYRLCESKNVAISAIKPFASGKLLSKDFTPFAKPMSVSQCLHYCLTRAGVANVLAGCASAQEVIGCCEYLAASEKDKDFTSIISTMKESFEGSCVYCNHCEPCPVNIRIAGVNQSLDVALLNENSIPDYVIKKYAALEAHGGDCIACGKCEERCPFSVQIIENMRKASGLFGY